MAMRWLVLVLVLWAAALGAASTAQQPAPAARQAARIRVADAGPVAFVAAGGQLAVGVGQQLQFFDLNEPATPRDLVTVELAGAPLAIAASDRATLVAVSRGGAPDEIVVVAPDRHDALNEVDEAVTLASLAPFDVVEPRQMVATIKIIPFAVPRAMAERCAAIAAEGGPLLRVAAFQPRQVGLVQTRLPGTKPGVLDKTVEILNLRLAALGCPPVVERRCDHGEAPLAETIAALRRDGVEMILVSGASAITDRRDVIPAALTRLGGTVEHLGMPVDPGNLLMLGRLDDKPFLGLPGCVRSPKLNGFDWVLQRLMADLAVTRRDIVHMGAGGLLK